MPKIKNIEVEFDENCGFHKTKEVLICDKCKQQVPDVFVIKHPNSEEENARFACFENCVQETIKEMFESHTDDHMEICGVRDISFNKRNLSC